MGLMGSQCSAYPMWESHCRCSGLAAARVSAVEERMRWSWLLDGVRLLAVLGRAAAAARVCRRLGRPGAAPKPQWPHGVWRQVGGVPCEAREDSVNEGMEIGRVARVGGGREAGEKL